MTERPGTAPRATPAPALLLLSSQLDAAYPGRSKGLDGIMRPHGQGAPSDHWYGNALDVTHDPARGLDIGKLSEEFRRQMASAPVTGRLTYIIANGRIASAKSGWKWRTYGRSCPHVRHAHFSLKASHRSVTRRWTLPGR